MNYRSSATSCAASNFSD